MRSDVDIGALRKHIGTKITEEDVATLAPLKGLIATFDREEPPPAYGEPIAPGWHLAYFLAASPKATLAADGLPTTGGVLPEMPFPRRMYAGTKLTFHDAIRVGDVLSRETEFTDVSLRPGSTGPLIFATQTRRIFTPRGLAIVEESHTVFRDQVQPGEKSGIPKRNAPPADLAWHRTVVVDPVSLFRYSALTFNPHRIHYDRPYATLVEGYPGLVVHGPYTQQCLLDLARDHTPGKTLKSFDLRARAPLFDIAPFSVVGRPVDAGSGAELWAVTPEGSIAIQVIARFS